MALIRVPIDRHQNHLESILPDHLSSLLSITNRNDVVKRLADELINQLRAMLGNVDAELRHYSYRIGVQSGRTSTCTENVEPITCDMTQ